MRAQAAGGDNKDTAVDVNVSNQGNQQQGTAVERQPRRMALDISPFGKYICLLFFGPDIELLRKISFLDYCIYLLRI